MGIVLLRCNLAWDKEARMGDASFNGVLRIALQINGYEPRVAVAPRVTLFDLHLYGTNVATPQSESWR